MKIRPITRKIQRNKSANSASTNTTKKCYRPLTNDKQKLFIKETCKQNSQKKRSLNISLSSTNWCLFDNNCNYFEGYRDSIQRQVASLTKIMTTIVALEFIDRYKLSKDIFIKISRSSTALNGTTANLKQNKWIKLYDLLYGAMLPSGNDAAFLLAQVFGLLLFYQNLKPQDKVYEDIQCIDLSCYETTSTFINKFLKHMNQTAKQLRMTKTVFANPHGLSNVLNVSTAKDMIILSKYAYKNEQFRKIMNTKQFKCELFADNLQDIVGHLCWKNTNKLLHKGWQGIKTGQTVQAGGCLSSYKDGIFIVVLNCKNSEARFSQTSALLEWYLQNTKLCQSEIF